jgi:hypothetical protein
VQSRVAKSNCEQNGSGSDLRPCPEDTEDNSKMSGDGLISIRLPRTLFELLRTALQRSGRDLHGGARFLISYLDCLSPDELASIPEPPNEAENPRVSFYVGRYVLTLEEISLKTRLSKSSIFRRLVYGLFVTKSLGFVQHSENKEWRLVRVQNGAENSCSQTQEGNTRAAR